MRVGYLTYGLDAAPTGIGRYSLELLEGLVALPDAPEIVLLTTEERDPYNLWPRFERQALPGLRRLPALLTVGNLTLSRVARRLGLDLLHDPNGIAPFFGPSQGVGRLVTIHDTAPFVSPATHNRLDNWRYRWLLPRVLPQTDLVLTDSHNSGQNIAEYLKVPPCRIRPIHLGVSARFQLVAEPGPVLARYGLSQPYLLYVGGLNARKNLARLLEAFARLLPRYPDLRLVINGKRQWRLAELDAAFERLALADQVIFTGYVADEDLPALYSGATLFVFPSLYEGFGLPVLEAMACGTPVVTSNVSSLPEVAGDAAILVDPYSVEAIAAGIEQGLSDEDYRAELRRRGLVRAATFTWSATAAQTLAAYREVLALKKKV